MAGGTGRIRKKKDVEKDVWTLAKERVNTAYDLFDTVVVSFSGGKDSTAVLNVALEVARERGKLPLEVIHFDEEVIATQTVEYVERVRQHPDINLRWLCLPIKCRNACSRKAPYWYPWDEADRDKWARPLPEGAITAADLPGFPARREDRVELPDTVGLLFDPIKYGRVGMLLGIRAEESITRTRAVLMRGRDSRSYIREWTGGFARGNLFKVYPIYDWRTADVWTAPHEFGWDYNRAYDVMEKCGFPANQQRIGAACGEEPMRALWYYKEADPAIWAKACRRVPGAATAARYAMTSLYSYGGTPEKPGGMTWQEWLRYWISKHPEPYRTEVAKRCKSWIAAHYKKTDEPLAEKQAHPLTGLSWKFIVNIAVRGDYKGRRQVNVNAADYDANRRKYDAEIELMKAREDV